MKMNPTPLDAAEAKEQLILNCTLDRLHLKLLVRNACRQPVNPVAHALSVAEDALAFTNFLPGGLGRWAGHLRYASKLIRQWCR